MTITEEFRSARNQLLELREDYDRAHQEFLWPRFEEFNFALDWFDAIADDPKTANNPALIIVEEDGGATRRSFADLSRRSNQVANWLKDQGVRRGDRIVVMLGNQVELWETFLAGMKLGAVLIPSTVMLGPRDLQDRIDRGRANWVVVGGTDIVKFNEVTGNYTLVVVGENPAMSSRIPLRYADSTESSVDFETDAPTKADDTLLLYFTSGTTSRAKLVEHTHTSYPVGHLATMYWIGLEPGDVHLNVASPGWAKHAWSNIFAPWIAEACVFIYNYSRFDATALMHQMEKEKVTSFCAPPTVWRMLIQADLSSLPTPPRKVVAAGEPLNPEIITQVQKHWGVEIRDGFGQTESTVQIANTPGQPVKHGSMGRPLPGYEVVLLDLATGKAGNEGEICLRLDPRPIGLMAGYHDDPEKTTEVIRDGYYHTGDVASRDDDGVITFVGRADDVFKASDYRLSPFELESVLIEHEAVAEVAVVPSPDSVRMAVPKAYVQLSANWEPTSETAESILDYARANLAPYKRIRRLEFSELPKTISGKIRRNELRQREQEIHGDDIIIQAGAGGVGHEYSDTDFQSQ
jgi:acetyl-CoA synthetase